MESEGERGREREKGLIAGHKGLGHRESVSQREGEGRRRGRRDWLAS